MTTAAVAATVALVATYLGSLGTAPFESRPLFPYLALVGFAVAAVVAWRAPEGGAPAQQAAGLAVAGASFGFANVVLGLVVDDGSGLAAAVSALGLLGVLWAVRRLRRGQP